MAFTKETASKAGRKSKRGPNKLTKPLREALVTFLEDSWHQVTIDFKKLDGRDKIKFYCELLGYAVPKMKHVEHAEVPTLEVFLRMEPEERAKLIKELSEKLKNG